MAEETELVRPSLVAQGRGRQLVRPMAGQATAAPLHYVRDCAGLFERRSFVTVQARVRRDGIVYLGSRLELALSVARLAGIRTAYSMRDRNRLYSRDAAVARKTRLGRDFLV